MSVKVSESPLKRKVHVNSVMMAELAEIAVKTVLRLQREEIIKGVQLPKGGSNGKCSNLRSSINRRTS